MEINNFTREELAQYILKTANETVIQKIKLTLSQENKNEIIAHTINGKSMNLNQYKY